MTVRDRLKRFFGDKPVPAVPQTVTEKPAAPEWPKVFKSPMGTILLQFPDGRLVDPVRQREISLEFKFHDDRLRALNIERHRMGLSTLSRLPAVPSSFGGSPVIDC